MCSHVHSNIEIHHLNFSSRNMVLILDWWIFTKYCYFQGHRSEVTGSNIQARPLLVEETRAPGENQTCRKSLTNFYHIMLHTSPWSRFELTTSVVIGTDCIGSCKFNYHTITATTSPQWIKMCMLETQSTCTMLQEYKCLFYQW
jgi:hypothetical protein